MGVRHKPADLAAYTGRNLYGDFGVKRFLVSLAEIGQSVFLSITAVAAGRFDVGEVIKVETGNSFERLRSSAVVQAVGQCRKPVGIVGLQRQQWD